MNQHGFLSLLCGAIALSVSYWALASTVGVHAATAPAAPMRVCTVPAKIVVGRHSKRYWDGHRYWTRRQWKARLPAVRR